MSVVESSAQAVAGVVGEIRSATLATNSGRCKQSTAGPRAGARRGCKLSMAESSIGHNEGAGKTGGQRARQAKGKQRMSVARALDVCGERTRSAGHAQGARDLN